MTSTATAASKLDAVENVDIDESGTFKYVLIRLYIGDLNKDIVRGFDWAEYHADIYEKEQQSLQALGIDTECLGGGRIKHDSKNKDLFVYGYSMGYGKADHTVTVKLLKEQYKDYEKVHYSDDGY